MAESIIHIVPIAALMALGALHFECATRMPTGFHYSLTIIKGIVCWTAAFGLFAMVALK